MIDVGAAIVGKTPDGVSKAGSSISNMYIYVPEEWWDSIDQLFMHMNKYNWDDASKMLITINRMISKDIQQGRR